jgi:hypothetical protein
MVDRLPSLELAKQAVTKELTSLVRAGFLTEVEQRQVSSAVSTARAMSEVATPTAARHFKTISTKLDIRLDSPVSRARECLGRVSQAWEVIRSDFHRFRKMTAEMRLKRAEAERLRAGSQDDPVALARAELLDVEADAMEADLEVGASQFRLALEKVQAQSARFDAICQKAGKQFTEDDFREEEHRYVIQALLWHLAQTSKQADMRDQYERADSAARWARMREQGMDRAADFREQQEKVANSKVILPSDAKRALIELGIPVREVEADVRALIGMREAHDLLGPRVDSFEPKFDGWIQRTSAKYVDHVRSSISVNGQERLDRIIAMLNPEATQVDKQGPAWGTVSRGSAIEDDH